MSDEATATVQQVPATGEAPREAQADAPLRGLRILDLADPLGAYAGRLLALLGADVLRVEGGDAPSTRRAPFHPRRPDVSLWDLYANESKRRVRLEGARAFERLDALIAGADAVLWSSLRGPRGPVWETCGTAATRSRSAK